MAEEQDHEKVPTSSKPPALIISLIREKPIPTLVGAIVIGVLLGRLSIL